MTKQHTLEDELEKVNALLGKSTSTKTKKEKNMKTKKAHIEKKEVKKEAKKEVKKAKPSKPAKKKGDQRGKFGRPKCKGGKYKSIRHLLESMFAKKEGLTREEADAAVKKFFPTSRWVTFGSQWGSYNTRIHNRHEFVTMDPPKWAKKKHVAKIK